MAYECIGEFWYDSSVQRLRPRWVHPCDPELYLLGAMRVKPSGPGAGKLVPIYYDTDDTCHEVEWSGYCTKKDGKLKPILLLECECGPIIGYYCDTCNTVTCAERGDCEIQWEVGEAPLFMGMEFNGIVACSDSPLTAEQVNVQYALTQLSWWYVNDPGTYPTEVFGEDPPVDDCIWGYWNEESRMQVYLRLYHGTPFTHIIYSYKPVAGQAKSYFYPPHAGPACQEYISSALVAMSCEWGEPDVGGYGGQVQLIPFSN